MGDEGLVSAASGVASYITTASVSPLVFRGWVYELDALGPPTEEGNTLGSTVRVVGAGGSTTAVTNIGGKGIAFRGALGQLTPELCTTSSESKSVLLVTSRAIV